MTRLLIFNPEIREPEPNVPIVNVPDNRVLAPVNSDVAIVVFVSATVTFSVYVPGCISIVLRDPVSKVNA